MVEIWKNNYALTSRYEHFDTSKPDIHWFSIFEKENIL